MKFQLIAVCVILAVFSIQDVVCRSQYEREADKAESDWRKCISGLLQSSNRVATNMFGTPGSRACGMRISQQAALIAGSTNIGFRTCRSNTDEDEKFQCIIRTANSGHGSCSSTLRQLISC